MLARLVDTLPVGAHWVYEPKVDGYRGRIEIEGSRVSIISRNDRPLTDRFPELVDALRAALPSQCVVDGEIVSPAGAGVSFSGLQARMAGDRRQRVAFIAFDILALAGVDLRSRPLVERRAILEKTVVESRAVAVIPQTADAAVASRWVEGSGVPGVEGAVAKRGDAPYRPGTRGWLKVKMRRSVAVVVGGHRHGRLLLGLYGPDGRLHYVGQTVALEPPHRELLTRLVPVERGRAFTGRPPGKGRWPHDRYEEWVECEPAVVVEVAYTLVDGTTFRHAVRLLRVREDKEPAECTLDQLANSEG
jgi:ATP-dependent DNA ligase